MENTHENLGLPRENRISVADFEARLEALGASVDLDSMAAEAADLVKRAFEVGSKNTMPHIARMAVLSRQIANLRDEADDLFAEATEGEYAPDETIAERVANGIVASNTLRVEAMQAVGVQNWEQLIALARLIGLALPDADYSFKVE